MKKTFKLTHPKIKVPRLFEAIKHEVKKYIREENSFVSVLYNKLMEDAANSSSANNSRGVSCSSNNLGGTSTSFLSAKGGVQPSYVPSIGMSIHDQSSNCLNQTQNISAGGSTGIIP